MTISLIVATSLNHVIGVNNQLPWHLPADLKFFKSTTMGCPVVMGRKTFESIGRTLPGRKNVIITRNNLYNIEKKFDMQTTGSLREAVKFLNKEEQIFIIGGGEIFAQAIPLANSIYRTIVNTTINGDVFFPAINLEKFKLVWEEKHTADEKNNYDYTFQKFVNDQ